MNRYNQPWYSQIGWICPRCGASNAPFVRKCDCSGSVTSTGTSVTFGYTYTPISSDWLDDVLKNIGKEKGKDE